MSVLHHPPGARRGVALPLVTTVLAAGLILLTPSSGRADTAWKSCEGEGFGSDTGEGVTGPLTEECVRLLLEAGQFRLGERGFLAREEIGSGVFELGLVRPNRNWRSSGGGVALTVPFTGTDSFGLPDSLGIGATFLSIVLARSEASVFDDIGTVDVGPGFGLGIPGIGGGPTGIFLPFHPQNVVDGATYRGNLGWNLARFDLGSAPQDGAGTGFRVGVLYSGLDQSERFEGWVPAYGADAGFAYRFDAESTAFGVHGGFVTTQPVGGVAQVWDTSLTLGAEVGLAHVRARGNADLNFTGALGVVPPSFGTYTASGFRPYASVFAGIESVHRPSGFRAGLGVDYQIRPWGVGFSGDGTNPYTMSLQNMGVWRVTARLGVQF